MEFVISILKDGNFILLKRVIRAVAGSPQGIKKGIHTFHLWTDVENMVYVYIGIIQLLKSKAVQIHATAWMNLEDMK